MKKRLIVVLVVILVFAFTTTAFAQYMVDASWSSTKCLNGFTTTQAVQKYSTNYVWDFVNVGLYGLSFASAPEKNYLYFQPVSNGVYVGEKNYILNPLDSRYDERGAYIYENCARNYNSFHLWISNPNKGNNMVSGGFWEGYFNYKPLQ
jgi:hypothetical protein